MTQCWIPYRFVVAVFAALGAGVALEIQSDFVDDAAAADAASASTAAAVRPSSQADEKAIRATAEDFVNAFNAADV